MVLRLLRLLQSFSKNFDTNKTYLKQRTFNGNFLLLKTLQGRQRGNSRIQANQFIIQSPLNPFVVWYNF